MIPTADFWKCMAIIDPLREPMELNTFLGKKRYSSNQVMQNWRDKSHPSWN